MPQNRFFVGLSGFLGSIWGWIVRHSRGEEFMLSPETLRELSHVASQIRTRTQACNSQSADGSSKFSGVLVLLCGPDNVANNLAARAIAQDLNRDLFRIDLSSVVSKYVDETEKSLSAAFKQADSGRSILFFDEADAVFGKRSEVADSHDHYANVEMNYLLQLAEGFHGGVVFATLEKNRLHPDVVRAMDLIVNTPVAKPCTSRSVYD